jgi:apolipoprotein D and lipocalin family protein
MKRGRLLAWVVCLGLAGASVAGTGCNSEPALDVAPNVDLSQFQGKWYEIARLPRTTQTNCFGTTAFYTQSADGSLSLVNQCNEGASDGPLTTQAMTATVPDTNVPAKLALDVGGFSGDYWILEVGPNYEYAVVGHPSRLYLWILSRTASLDTGTLSGIVSRAQNNQFDTSKLEFTPQPPEGERDTLSTPEGPVPPAVHTGCSTAFRGTRHGSGGAWFLGLVGAAMGLGVWRRRARALRGRAGFRHSRLPARANFVFDGPASGLRAIGSGAKSCGSTCGAPTASAAGVHSGAPGTSLQQRKPTK